MKLIDYINQKTNNTYKDFKLVSVIFDEKKLECCYKFLYKNAEIQVDADVQIIRTGSLLEPIEANSGGKNE